MRKLMLILLIAASLGMGCANKLMQPIESATIDGAVGPNETVIVFFRATSFGGAVQAPVIEASEDGALSYVAVISAGKKYLHRTTPGKHLYIVGGESSEMLEADMEGGKTYYTYVSPRMGIWKARFVFVPVSNTSSEEFKKDVAWCNWVQNTPDGQAWFLDNLPSLQSKYAEALKKHQEATPDKRKTLKPEHGAAVPVL
jgi:hypothetical protein